MNDQAIVKVDAPAATLPEAVEQALVNGNLANLSAAQRVVLYDQTCDSLGLNRLTTPFAYITLNGKLVLYATRNCTDQLRKIHNVDVTITSRERMEDIYVVTARAKLPNGRTDEEVGAVALGNARGEALANALMKATTKAKRRVTLSIVGLSLLDETEVETIPGAKVFIESEAPASPVVDPPVLAGTSASRAAAPPASPSTRLPADPLPNEMPAEAIPEGEAAPITAWFGLTREHLHLTRAQTRSYFATNNPMDSDEDAVRAVLADLDLKPTDKALSRLFAVVSDAVLAKRNEAQPQPAMAGGASDISTCEQCGAPLSETVFRDGTRWEIAQLAGLGKRKHGRVLCMNHYKDANKARLADAPVPDPIIA